MSSMHILIFRKCCILGKPGGQEACGEKSMGKGTRFLSLSPTGIEREDDPLPSVKDKGAQNLKIPRVDKLEDEDVERRRQ
jgi:hypothetical protein